MATISAAGIGSGLDVNSIVTQLMALERAPLDALLQKQSQLDAQISAYGQLKSAFSTFQSAVQQVSTTDNLSQFTTVSSDESVFTSSANSSASPGSFALIVNNIASRDKTASSSYADANTDLAGTGTLDISVGGNSMSITVDATTNTLAEIRDAINQSATNPGVTASIINESGGSRLIITGDDTGAANAVNISVTDTDGNAADNAGLSRLFYVGTGNDEFSRSISTAIDASFSVDGFNITSASNAVSDVIEGITINLQDAGSGTLSVAQDQTSVTEQIQTFADAYNELNTALDSLSGGILNTDSTLSLLQRQLRGVLGEGASIGGNPYTHLTHIGVEIDRYGVMSVNESTLGEILTSDPESVSSLFTHETEGFGVRLDAFAETLLQSGGILDLREDGLNDRKTSLIDQQDRLEYRLDLVETRYRAEFAALDASLAALQGTSDFLTQQLSSLNTA